MSDKVIGKVYQSTNYEQFVASDCNRTPRRNKKLLESMRKHGWPIQFPAWTRKLTNGMKEILGGQNRYAHAKDLKLPIVYVVAETNAITPSEAERPVVRWNAADYCTSYAKSKVQAQAEAYGTVIQKSFEWGLPVGTCVMLMLGKTHTGEISTILQDGKFRVQDMQHAETVVSILRAIRDAGHKWWAKKSLASAVSSALKVPSFNPEVFLSRIGGTQGQTMRNQPHAAGFIEEIERIYNWRTVPRLAIAAEIERMNQNQKDT